MQLSLTLTPERFATLSQELQGRSDVKVEPTKIDPSIAKYGTTGTITTSDVTLRYTYSPCAQQLVVDLVKKNSFKAKLAPDSVISQRITDLLQQA